MSNDTAHKIYTSLANKYRPQTFGEVVGQDSVSKTLMNAVKTGRISHAYLFYGPRGCGKTTTARILAKALNCTGGADPDKPNPTPCGKCPQCTEIAASADMDVLELDAASNTQVEKVREAIIETVSLSAGRDRFKVFILDEVHMLSTSSFNALLKTIEEPPAHVVFILATTELHKVPLTISSRCQTFRFKPIADNLETTHLMDLAGAEGIELEPAAAEVIAKNAGGALRDALTILDRAIAFSGDKITEASIQEMLGLMPKELVQKAAIAMVDKDGAALHQIFETMKQEGFDVIGLLKDLKKTFGDIFYFSLKAAPEPFTAAGDLLKKTSPAFIAGLTRKIARLEGEVKFSDTPALSAEVGLFTIMESALDIEHFLNRLSELESAINTGAPLTPSSEKKTFKTVEATLKPVEVAAPAPIAAAQDASKYWEDFVAEVSKNMPLLEDAIKAAAADFTLANTWQITFNNPDDKDITALRLKRLEDIAEKITGEKINFVLQAAEKPAKAAQPPAKPAAAVKPKPLVKPQPVFSDEPAFAQGDFSADLQTPKPAPSPKAEIKAEVKEPRQKYSVKKTAAAQKLLSVIEGSLVEEI